MQTSNLAASVTLHDGVRMPRLGLGVWQSPGPVAKRAVKAALAIGYRHIDTAQIYGNEKDVGEGIRESNVPRDQIFVTTKLWTVDHGYDSALRAFEGSLGRLGLETIDLYLSHFPIAGRRIDAWRAMATLVKGGRCRSIGVSNYTIRHLQELIEKTGVVPTVNQVEFNPYLYQKELFDFCKSQKIQLIAYSPMTHGKRLDDQKLVDMAERYERTPAQMLLRWGLQQGVAVIPKSSKTERIEENGAIFDFQISDADMRLMNTWNENLRTCWDSSDEP